MPLASPHEVCQPQLVMKRSFRNDFSRRLINGLVTASVRLGIGPSQRYLLTVPGRTTRTPHTTPVSLVIAGPDRYLVAPYGEVGWVRNARVAGAVTLTRKDRSERVGLAELSPAEAGPVLRRYLQLEPLTRPYFDVASTGPSEAFEAEAANHPVFRLIRSA